MRTRILWVGLALAACDDGGGSGAARDAAVPDAMMADAAVQDAAPDAAVQDAAPPDAGPLIPLDHPPSAACRGDLRPGEKVVFAQGFANGTEGITFAGGAAYVSEPRASRIWKLAADGTATQFAEVPHAIGLATAADGALLVADAGESNDPMVLDGALWRVDAAGTPTRLASDLPSPNFVVALPDGGALVSDDFDTRVFHVAADGTVSVAIPDVPSPNGMAYGPGRQALYVASTFTQQGEITRFGVGVDGLPDATQRQVLFAIGAGATLDGVAVDEHDQVYVAANVRGQILRVRGDGTGMPVVVASGLRTAASVAFGAAPDFDPCSLYVTELLGNRVWRIAVGATGVPLP
jgi:sugar lactone lactonase YvrE